MAGLPGGHASAVGIEIAVAVIGGLLLGSWADGKLDTDPYLTLGGVVLGTIVGFRAVWHAAKASSEED